MEQKVIFLNDIDDKTEFPVVDILKLKPNGEEERLGCCATALTNFTIALDLYKGGKFKSIQEMALMYEALFKKDGTDNVSPKQAFEVIDGFLNEHQDTLEKFIYRADTANFEAILYLLGNDFVALLASDTPELFGHCDVIHKTKDGRVYFNCFEINYEDLAELIFSTSYNMICLARNKKKNPPLLLKSSEMGSLIFKLGENERYYLTEREQFILENDMVEVFVKYPTKNIPELFKEKEYLLRNLGLLDKNTTVIYPAI